MDSTSQASFGAVSQADSQLQVRIGNTLRELAHEFGNLAFPLQMMLELQARAAPLSPDELTRLLRGHVDEMTTLTERFRCVGRCLTGRLEPCWTSLECDDLVRTSLDLCRFPRAAGRSLQFDLAAAPESVYGDRELLQLALAELIDNALRFTPAETAIVVTVQQQGGNAEFAVVDTGPGVAGELQSHVFDPFVHGSRKLDLATGQLGCGLAIVRAVAHVHHGAAEMRRSSDAGSEFVLRVPVQRGA